MTRGIYLQEANFINAGAHKIARQVHLHGCAVGRDWDSSEGFQAIIKGENGAVKLQVRWCLLIGRISCFVSHFW